MIAIEIRNDELRAVKFKGGLLQAKKIDKVSSVKVEFSEISGLSTGKILPLVDKVSALLYKLDLGDITKEKYTVSVNLEGVMTQRVMIPKVKDNQIVFSAKSALAKNNILIEEDKLVSFAVQKEEHVEEKSRGYNIITQSIDRSIAASVVGIFDHLELTVKYVDISPNTIIKMFNKSSYVETDKPLSLIIDLSEEGMRYYQFMDNNFHFSYLERVGHRESGYLDVFESNIYQFLDEFREFTLGDIDILLMGDEEIIKEVVLNFDGIFELQKFSDGIDLYPNPNDIPLDKYINSIGSLIRNDLLMSSQAKYDINLLKDIKSGIKSTGNKDLMKKVIVMGVVSVVVSGSYLGFIKYSNMQLENKNIEITNFLDDPETLAQISKKEGLSAELSVYDKALDTLLVIEDYLETTKHPYGSRVYYSLTQSTPKNSRVSNLKYSAGAIEISYETTDENTFKEYLKSLNENPLIKNVDYSGYTTGGDGYTGSIKVELKGRVK